MNPPNELWRLSAAELAAGYVRGTFTPIEVIDAVLARIDAVNGAVNAIVTLDLAGVRAQAEASAARWSKGTPRSGLDGIPITVKDNLNVQGLRTTWGSRLYADFVPTVDELPVKRVRDAGMVIIGKTNVPEFTLSGYTDNELFGPTRNPWQPELTPGGSSGGAVAAVAAGMAPLALGTDGGGSARRPASYAGVVGFKPSRGRIARAEGLPQILLDFEVVAPIARTVQDVDMMMSAIAKSSPRDLASTEYANRPWSLPPRKPQRILYAARFGDAPVDPQIERSVADTARRFSALGHAVTEGAVPFDADAFNAVWPVISQAGLAALLRKTPNWRESISRSFADMVDAGSALPATALFEAWWEIARTRERIGETFATYDVLLTPSAAALPWPARQAYPRRIADRTVGPRGHAVFSAFVNASGCAAISVPCGPSAEGLPIGFQLVAPPGHDERLCVLAREYEQVGPWAGLWPPL